jgi:hypothetical protein
MSECKSQFPEESALKRIMNEKQGEPEEIRLENQDEEDDFPNRRKWVESDLLWFVYIIPEQEYNRINAIGWYRVYVFRRNPTGVNEQQHNVYDGVIISSIHQG